MKTNWKNWIKAAGVRAIKTVAQTAVATIGTNPYSQAFCLCLLA